MITNTGCGLGDIHCGVGQIIQGFAHDALKSLAEATYEGFGQVMASLGTSWLYVDTPNLAAGESGSNSDVVAFIQANLTWIAGVIAVVALIVAAIRMILTMRGAAAAQIARGLLTLAAVTAAGVPLLSILIAFGDEFSVWFVNQALDGEDFGANLALSMAALIALPGGALIVVIVGVIAIVVSLIQVVLILVRMVMLVLLAGMLPVAASMATTEGGMNFLKKYLGWTIAFLVYKPIAAVIYGTAFILISNGTIHYTPEGAPTVVAGDEFGTSVLNLVAGVGLMSLSVVALAALMKFVVPAVSAIGGGGMGGAVAAGAGAAATGAVSLAGAARGVGGGSGGKATSGATPSGAAPAGAASSAGTTSAGAAATGAGAAAGGGGGVAAGAGAGSVGGPVGMGVGAAAGVALGGAAQAAAAAKGATNDAVEGGGTNGL